MPDACPHGRCVNTMGSYRCLCEPGYQVDSAGTGCTDVNECRGTTGVAGPCSHVCRNTPGSYVCSCPAGYRLSSDRRTCRDVDECATDRHGCAQDCVNLPGSFQCRCHDGYRAVDSTCVGKRRRSVHACDGTTTERKLSNLF